MRSKGVDSGSGGDHPAPITRRRPRCARRTAKRAVPKAEVYRLARSFGNSSGRRSRWRSRPLAQSTRDPWVRRRSSCRRARPRAGRDPGLGEPLAAVVRSRGHRWAHHREATRTFVQAQRGATERAGRAHRRRAARGGVPEWCLDGPNDRRSHRATIPRQVPQAPRSPAPARARILVAASAQATCSCGRRGTSDVASFDLPHDQKKPSHAEGS